MSKKNKKKRNNNNTRAPEAPADITRGVSDCKLEDSEPQPEPGPDKAWTIERSEGCDPHLVATRDIKPLEVVIEDKAIVTVPVAKVQDLNLMFTLHLRLF